MATKKQDKEFRATLEGAVLRRIEASDAEAWFRERGSELQSAIDNLALARRENEHAAMRARVVSGHSFGASLAEEENVAMDGCDAALADQKDALRCFWSSRLVLPVFFEMHVKELALHLRELPQKSISLLLADWAACERLALPAELPASIDPNALVAPANSEINSLIERMTTLAAMLRRASLLLSREIHPLRLMPETAEL